MRLAAISIALAVVLTASAASAQRQPFVEHVIAFRSLLFGPYGDEGPRASEEIDRLSAALSAWDRSGRSDERAPAQAHAAVNAYLAFTATRSPETSDSISPSVLAMLDALARRTAADPPVSKPFPESSLIPDDASTSPLFAPAAYADGFNAIASGNYAEAVAFFRAAAAKDPLIIDPVSRSEPMSIGIAMLRAGRMQEAIAPLESAAAKNRDSSEVHRILGTTYGAVGNDAKAIEHLQLAVRLAPRDERSERSRVALARALGDAGRLDEAAQSIRDTISVLPGSAEARWTLAGILAKAGRGIEAARELDEAATLTVVAGRTALNWRAAEIYDLHQNFDRVTALLRQRVRLTPNNPAVHKQLGLVQSRLGHSDEAFAELAMADLLGGADAESLAALGQLHLGAGRLQDAESVLRRAVALQPDRQDARYALGRTLLQQGRAGEAREQLDAFQRVRDRAMDDQRRTFEIDKLRAQATQQSAAGHASEAAAIWGQIVERLPGSAEFRVAAADALAAIGEFQKAAEHLEKAASFGAWPAVQLRLAEVYAKLGRREESEHARQAYEQQMKDLLARPLVGPRAP